MSNQVFINQLAENLQKLNNAAHLAGDICICVDGYIPFGAHRLDGSTLKKADYPVLWNKIQERCVSNAQWEAEARENDGDCSRYADVDSTYFRLPKVTGYLKSSANRGHIKEKPIKVDLNHVHRVGGFVSWSAGYEDTAHGVVFTDRFPNGTVVGTVGGIRGYDRGNGIPSSVSPSIGTSAPYTPQGDPINSGGGSSGITPVTTKVILCVYLVNVGGFRDVSEYTAGQQEMKLLSNRISALETGGDTVIVVDSAVNSDGSWYRKWSDGFLEQGGVNGHWSASDSYRTLTFPVPYTQSKTIRMFLTFDTRRDATDWCSLFLPYSVTNTTFEYRATSRVDTKWYACGY